ncbi:hypothetical protein, partial [Mesorhizobium sp. M7A.F.Ca.US.001.04.1.1]
MSTLASSKGRFENRTSPFPWPLLKEVERIVEAPYFLNELAILDQDRSVERPVTHVILHSARWLLLAWVIMRLHAPARPTCRRLHARAAPSQRPGLAADHH